MVTEFEQPVSESSIRISIFYAAAASEYKFHKMGIENWQPIGIELGIL